MAKNASLDICRSQAHASRSRGVAQCKILKTARLFQPLYILKLFFHIHKSNLESSRLGWPCSSGQRSSEQENGGRIGVRNREVRLKSMCVRGWGGVGEKERKICARGEKERERDLFKYRDETNIGQQLSLLCVVLCVPF